MELKGIDKIFMIGDIHFGIRSNSLAWKDAQFAFFEKFIAELPAYGFNKQTDILMLSGDIFHSREFLNIYIMRQVIGLFQRLNEIFERGIYIIMGNHDNYSMRSNETTSISILSELFDNVHVFIEPEPLSIISIDECSYKFSMLPWCHDNAKLMDTLSVHAGEFNCEYVFAHMDIDGFKYNKVVNIEGGIPMDVLSRFKRVYSGHIHAKQAKRNVLYIGAPYQMDRGDSDTERGHYVLKLIAGDIIETFVNNDASPKFVRCDCEDLLNMSEHDLAGFANNNYVDIMAPTKIMRVFPFTRFDDYLGEVGIKPKKVEFRQIQSTELTTFEVKETGGVMNVFEAGETFLKHREYTPTESSKIMKYFTDLYTLAKNKNAEK